jgi:hypothetical protein
MYRQRFYARGREKTPARCANQDGCQQVRRTTKHDKPSLLLGQHLSQQVLLQVLPKHSHVVSALIQELENLQSLDSQFNDWYGHLAALAEDLQHFLFLGEPIYLIPGSNLKTLLDQHDNTIMNYNALGDDKLLS